MTQTKAQTMDRTGESSLKFLSDPCYTHLDIKEFFQRLHLCIPSLVSYSIIHHPAFCCLEKIFCTQAVAEAGLWLSVHLHPFLIRISVDFKGKEAFCLNFYKASFSLAFKFTGERGTAPSYQPRAYPHALSRYQVLPTCLKKKEKKPTVGNKILVNTAHFPAHNEG